MARLIRTATRNLILVTWLAALPTAVTATQNELPDERVRFGITLGGTAFVSLAVEYQFDNRGIELSMGTFSWRDLSVSVVGKQYVGGGDVRGLIGAGLWAVAAFPSDGRAGYALVLRAPLGVEGVVGRRHAAGFELNLNRAVSVRRTDPLDLRPARSRVVPLPAVYYRFGEPR